MNSSALKHEGWLYGLAFLIALALRCIALGVSPLTDSEAALALQSLALARGGSPLLAPQPAYILFTAVLFAVMEGTNFLARFLPALAGNVLVFVPYFFREKIHPRPALILAFLLAFDPGLVALSRQANGTMLAVAFLFLTWAAWNHRQIILTGVFAALALLSGPSLWAGLLTLALTRLFLQGMESFTAKNKIENRNSSIQNLKSAMTAPQLLIAFGATFLLCGTLFFFAPSGLSAALASIPAYLKGWSAPAVTTPGRILFTFFAYELFGIFLASLAVIRAARTNGKRAARLLLWLGASLLLAVFYRQPSELIWTVIPLLALSALELSRLFDIRREEFMETSIVTAVLSILFVYTWLNFAGMALNPSAPLSASFPLIGSVKDARALMLVGSLLIIVACTALVALGWSARTARIGATLTLTIFLGVYTIAAAWGASGLRYPNGFELWTTDPHIAQEDLLRASVDDLSEFSLGHPDVQPVTVSGILSPALEWALRNHSVKTASALDPQFAPPIVVTPLMTDLGLPSAYRGQDFTWREQPQWETLQWQDWLKWSVYRELPADNETVILWARDSLFPDARKSTQP